MYVMIRDMTHVCHDKRHDSYISLVGCNLGRAPEFTSKILHALNCHALNGRLASAIAALPAVGAWGGGGGALEKLVPVHRSSSKVGGVAGRASQTS
jgi:hypothetical protein